MKTQSEQIVDRLKTVMNADRMSGVENISKVIKSDIFDLLTSYMYLQIGDIELSIELVKDGNYILNLTAKSTHLIGAGKMIDE